MSTLEIVAAAFGAVAGWVLGGFVNWLHALPARPRHPDHIERFLPLEHRRVA